MKDAKTVKKLTEKYYTLTQRMRKLDSERKEIKELILSAGLHTKEDGQVTENLGKFKLVVKGSPDRKIDQALVLKDYKKMPSSLKSLFDLKASLKVKEYKKIYGTNKDLLAQYITENKPKYAVTVDLIEEKEDE